METARNSSAPLATIVRVAVQSDDPARLIAAAGLVVRRPLALVGPRGELLGYTPDGNEGYRAIAVARAAARSRLVGAAGWAIVPVVRASSRLGFLAIGERPDIGADAQVLLDTLPELVADQLHRVGLQRARRDAFVRRLVSDARFGAREARSEAGELRLALADAYWPAMITWHRATPPRAVFDDLARHALGRVEDSLIAVLESRMVLLYPSRGERADGEAASVWLRQVVDHAHALAPSFRAQAIAREEAVELGRLSAEVAELDVLRRFGPRADDEPPVVWSRHYALERLLWEDVDAAGARRFVDEQLGALMAWDRERRTDLLWILETALDFPRHDQAARRCFMHRNTFRHRLQQAEKVLGHPLDDPDVRLAVHIALKLRRLLLASAGPDGAETPSVPGRRHRRGAVRSSAGVVWPLSRRM